MAWPIVKVASGGLPVTEVASGRGTPVEVAANGFGTAVTVVASGGLPVVGTGGGGAPVTDPIVQSINADGKTFTASGTPPTFQPDTAPQFAYVTRAGFSGGNPTSFVDAIVLTRRLRQPAPNDAVLTTDQGVLSDYVYSTDTVVGKTVNSTEASPKPVANWALADRVTVGNTITQAVTAFHRDGRAGKPVECVIFRATDGASTVTQVVTTPTILGHSGDKNPVIGYPCSIDISSLSAGAITLNAKVYPIVGGAGSVLDSADSAVEREFSPRTYVKSASGPLYIYCVSGGNDTTGVLSANAATAKATPCATLAGAFTRARAQNGTVMDNVVIRLSTGTWELTANNAAGTYNTAAECIIERDPDVPFSDVTYRFGGNFQTRLTWARWRNLQLARTASGGLGLLATRGVIENCTCDNNGQTGHLLSTVTTSGLYILGLTITNGAQNILGIGGAETRLVRGVSGSGLQIEDRVILGCTTDASKPIGSAARGQSGCIVGFNKFMSAGSSAIHWYVGGTGFADVVGYAAIQNVAAEWISTSNNSGMRPSGDSDPANVTHLIDWHNTWAGYSNLGRHNLLYDESAGTTRRTHKLCSLVGPIAVQINHKTDKWVAYTNLNADSVNRIGAWQITFGTGCRGVFSQFAANSVNEGQDYAGLKSNIGTSTTVRNDPLFVDPKAVTSGPVAGAGGGDYRLQAGSPCIGMVVSSPLPFDLAGNARSATASAAGAYERLAP